MLCGLAALGLPSRVAARDLVQTEGGTAAGHIVEVAPDDYLIIRDDDGVEHFVRWEDLRMIRSRQRILRGTDLRGLERRSRARVSFGVSGSLGGLHQELLDPYFSAGFMLGVQGGITFFRGLSAGMGYEHGWLGGDERNPHTDASTDTVFGVVSYWTNAAQGGLGVSIGLGAGVRWASYAFRSGDGSVRDAFYEPQGTLERAWLIGRELRFPAGLTITMSPTLTMEIGFVISAGRMYSYRDTLRCNTFRLGSCGGGYDIEYSFTQATMGFRWN